VIQTPEGQDRGAALFAQFPGAVTACVKNRKAQYFESAAYKALRNLCRSMDQYIDNNSPAVSTFISDITPPVIRRAYHEGSALFLKFLETDPLFGVRRNNTMSVEQQERIQAYVNDNLEKTYYRDRCLQWSVDDIMRYGTALTYTFATNDYNANSLMTVKGTEGEFGDYKQVYGEGENVAISTPVHPLNGIVDPRSNHMVEPEYMGFIGDISVANIKNLTDNPVYVRENLQKVFEESKKGLSDEHWFGGTGVELKDFTRGHSNITYMWLRLPIEGNEDDPTWYCVEMIGEYVIRIEENPLDENTIPLAIKRVFPRKYQWYGNSPLIDKVSVQNLMYWLVNTSVESTARLMDRIVLYREGTLDVEAINSRHQTGGLVPYRGQEQSLEKLMYGVDLPNNAFRESDWLMQEMRREDQDTSFIPNFNPQSEGGPTNKTLGGAQMMASIGEMKASYLVNQMATGLKDVAKHQLVLLRNLMSDKPAQLGNGGTITKDQMLGKVSFAVKISNVFNYIREGLDSENRLTNAINRRATQIKQFSCIKLGPMIMDSLRNSLKRENIDDYVDSAALKKMDEADMQAALAPPPPVVPPAGGGTVPAAPPVAGPQSAIPGA
jgi:hypothetical protein